MTGELLRLRDGLVALLPAVATLLLVLVGTIPFGVPYLGPVMPSLAIAAVYYWAARRPSALPLPATFALGLVQDSLVGTALGQSAVILLAVQAVVGTQRRLLMAKPFHVFWFGFACLAPGAAMLRWTMDAVMVGGIPPVVPALVQIALTIVAFPVVAWFMARIEHALPAPA